MNHNYKIKLPFTDKEIRNIHLESLESKMKKITELKHRVELGGELTPLEKSILEQWKQTL